MLSQAVGEWASREKAWECEARCSGLCRQGGWQRIPQEGNWSRLVPVRGLGGLVPQPAWPSANLCQVSENSCSRKVLLYFLSSRQAGSQLVEVWSVGRDGMSIVIQVGQLGLLG